MKRELRNIDLNLLVVFTVLAEEQHLTRSAERLHMSQPAVSNALSRLRDTFNDELFVRAPKGMKPTARAQELVEPIRVALDIIQSQLQEPQHFEPSTAKLKFCISVNGYAEFGFLPKFVDRLTSAAPSIDLQVVPESDSHTPERIRSGDIDLAIDYLEIPGKDFHHEPLFEETLVVASRKDHPALSTGLTIEHYQRLPHVVVHPRSHRGSPTEIILGKKKIKRIEKVSVSNMISLPAMTAQSNMICTLPKTLATKAQQFIPIDLHALPFGEVKIAVSMIYHRDKRNDVAHHWFRDLLQSALLAELG